MVVYPAPRIRCEINHGQRAGWKFFPQPLAQLDIPGRDQDFRRLVQAGIVADRQQASCLVLLGTNDRQNGLRGRHIEAFVEADLHHGGPLRRQRCHGLPGPGGRRTQDQIGKEAMPCHVGAHQPRGRRTALIERADHIGQSRRPVRFGVAQQHETAHGGNIDFRPRKV